MDSKHGEDDYLWEYPDDQREAVKKMREESAQCQQKTSTSVVQSAPKAKPTPKKNTKGDKL